MRVADMDPSALIAVSRQLDTSASGGAVGSKERASPPGTHSDNDSGCPLDEYTWVPPGLTPAQVHAFMRSLPESKIPYVGRAGSRYRTGELLRQLPPQDCEARHCLALSDEEKRELRLFSAARRRDALGRGTVRPVTPAPTQGDAPDSPTRCKQCRGSIQPGTLAVMASRAGPDAHWHPACFVCCECRELLVDLIYFWAEEGCGEGRVEGRAEGCGEGHVEGHVYCGRHHAERLKPRCTACDEIIFSDECTEAEGRSWHLRHFACTDCDAPLGGRRYVMRVGRPFCTACYELRHADRCHACRRAIGVDDGHMVHEGRQWHATDECFRCGDCERSLVGRAFLPKSGVFYCTECCGLALSGGKMNGEYLYEEAGSVDEKKEKGIRKSSCDRDGEFRESSLDRNEGVSDSRSDDVYVSWAQNPRRTEKLEGNKVDEGWVEFRFAEEGAREPIGRRADIAACARRESLPSGNDASEQNNMLCSEENQCERVCVVKDRGLNLDQPTADQIFKDASPCGVVIRRRDGGNASLILPLNQCDDRESLRRWGSNTSLRIYRNTSGSSMTNGPMELFDGICGSAKEGQECTNGRQFDDVCGEDGYVSHRVHPVQRAASFGRQNLSEIHRVMSAPTSFSRTGSSLSERGGSTSLSRQSLNGSLVDRGLALPESAFHTRDPGVRDPGLGDLGVRDPGVRDPGVRDPGDAVSRLVFSHAELLQRSLDESAQSHACGHKNSRQASRERSVERHDSLSRRRTPPLCFPDPPTEPWHSEQADDLDPGGDSPQCSDCEDDADDNQAIAKPNDAVESTVSRRHRSSERPSITEQHRDDLTRPTVIGARSRKDRQLSVRFDPSIKDVVSPAAGQLHYSRRHRRARRAARGDEGHWWERYSDHRYADGYHDHCHSSGRHSGGRGPEEECQSDGALSARRRIESCDSEPLSRRYRPELGRGVSRDWSDLERGKTGRSQLRHTLSSAAVRDRRAERDLFDDGVRGGESARWSVYEGGDDEDDRCSTCSSSSSDSWDYSSLAYVDLAPGLGGGVAGRGVRGAGRPQWSATLPPPRCFSAGTARQGGVAGGAAKQKKKWYKKKNCAVS